jgi:hypothetical protein
MDFALQLNLTDKQLLCINTCQLCLKVLTISDITNARGDNIIPEAMQGLNNPQRISQLMWPIVPRPPDSFWTQWRILLQHISRNMKLLKPLGDWVGHPNQTWYWF